MASHPAFWQTNMFWSCSSRPVIILRKTTTFLMLIGNMFRQLNCHLHFEIQTCLLEQFNLHFISVLCVITFSLPVNLSEGTLFLGSNDIISPIFRRSQGV